MGRLPEAGELGERLTGYLERLRVPGQVGRYRPATSGLTPEGEQLALGTSCYAHKLAFTLGLWEALPPQEQAAWNAYLCRFQVEGDPLSDWAARNAFVDPVVAAYLTRRERGPARLVRWMRGIGRQRELNDFRRAIVAETKQALATLAEVGAASRHPYDAFPQQPEAVQEYLGKLDWSQPWGAGAHLATLAVFFRTEGPRVLPAEAVAGLVDTASRFAEGVLDPSTGAYFEGARPPHGQLINGAMKVLTALDWLDVPVHEPERLIDTCLAERPRSEGCHLVDAVYVLHRCARLSDHRRDDVSAYCSQLQRMIERHWVPEEGGFSYHVGASQTVYYGVPITRGEPVADLHGTILLTWALAMIQELLGDPAAGWRVIRP